MGALYGIWTWFAFGSISAICYVVSLLGFLVTAPFDPQRRVTGRAIRISGQLMCAAVPMWRFSIQRPVPSQLPFRCVCVSNHCSNIDPFILAHLPWEMKFLAKSVLFQIPFVGWGIKIAGDIPLVRGSAKSVKRAMRKAGWYVRNGMPVLIFAEGTRSTTDDLLPFKDGAFKLAIEEQAHILPIAVWGSRGALRPGEWKPAVAKASVLVGEPISAEGLALTDLAELKAKTRDAIVELRDELSRRGF